MVSLYDVLKCFCLSLWLKANEPITNQTLTKLSRVGSSHRTRQSFDFDYNNGVSSSFRKPKLKDTSVSCLLYLLASVPQHSLLWYIVAIATLSRRYNTFLVTFPKPCLIINTYRHHNFCSSMFSPEARLTPLYIQKSFALRTATCVFCFATSLIFSLFPPRFLFSNATANFCSILICFAHHISWGFVSDHPSSPQFALHVSHFQTRQHHCQLKVPPLTVSSPACFTFSTVSWFWAAHLTYVILTIIYHCYLTTSHMHCMFHGLPTVYLYYTTAGFTSAEMKDFLWSEFLQLEISITPIVTITIFEKFQFLYVNPLNFVLQLNSFSIFEGLQFDFPIRRLVFHFCWIQLILFETLPFPGFFFGNFLDLLFISWKYHLKGTLSGHIFDLVSFGYNGSSKAAKVSFTACAWYR